MITELSRKILLQRDPETAHPLAIVELRLFCPAQRITSPWGLSRGTR